MFQPHKNNSTTFRKREIKQTQKSNFPFQNISWVHPQISMMSRVMVNPCVSCHGKK
jgi:hypothetical protein